MNNPKAGFRKYGERYYFSDILIPGGVFAVSNGVKTVV